MDQNFRKYISNLLSEEVLKINSVSGGDISNAYHIQTNKNSYFIKCNESSKALKMFETEAKGLKLIAKTNTIKTPLVVDFGYFDNTCYLILEYIESKPANNEDLENLGNHLANLHQSSESFYGLDYNNFIGKLPQANKKHANWTNFYIEERLSPQFELAKNKNLLGPHEIPSKALMYEVLEPMLNDVKSCLLHGDLWSGNYIISKDGIPYLIDPATFYGHNEIDIAMSKLFGGFGDTFYDAYFSICRTDNFTDSRLEIYQLYYLLVHLNMFGISYYGSVKRIVQKYF